MKRKQFITTALLGGVGLALNTPSTAKPAPNTPMEPIVGLNHLPLKEKEKYMKSVIHRANTRGNANHGWLNAHHTFSFSSYYNPERMNFGVLRVLNDDIIAGGEGFGRHPHDNMEIITIPIQGALQHKDSMGNTGVIKENEVQMMSAGTGIYHSEFNHHESQPINLLQIWLFPKVQNVTPKYEQKTYHPDDRKNTLKLIVSPLEDDAMTINQDAYFSLGNLDAGFQTKYDVKHPGNGVYAFVISGEVDINGTTLNPRDGMGVWDTNHLDIKVSKEAEILLMDIPMEV
jgi:redox-sensitive bicupin YhaK (pirin superfamily)